MLIMKSKKDKFFRKNYRNSLFLFNQKYYNNTKAILEDFHEWLIIQSKSKLGQAISYTLNVWDKLVIFLEYGRHSQDNNIAERAIKPYVIGRKNWLLSKSIHGAKASGIVYSILETAKVDNLDVFKYLMYIFEEIHNIILNDYYQLDAFLPW